MPQIWLTYEELSDQLGCAPQQARDGAIAAGWDRRRCSDGLTRVKLRPAVAAEYLRERIDHTVRSTLAAQRLRIAELEAELAARTAPRGSAVQRLVSHAECLQEAA